MNKSSDKNEVTVARREPKLLDLIRRYGFYPHEMVNPKISPEDKSPQGSKERSTLGPNGTGVWQSL